MQDLPADLEVQLEAEDLQKRLDQLVIPVSFSDGRVEKVVPKFRASYKDEYTGDALPHAHICTAMADELT